MKKLTLLFDLDGMITDLYGTWLPTYDCEMAEDGEDELDAASVEGALHHHVQNPKGLWEIMNRKGFFEHLQPLPGGIETVAWAKEQGHDCKILTSPGQSIYAPSEKTIWVLKHMPFLKQNDIGIFHDKWLVDADALLDDSVNKVDAWKERHPNGATMGIAWPYNADGNFDLRADDYQDTEAAWATIRLGIERLADGAGLAELPEPSVDIDPQALALGAAMERNVNTPPKEAVATAKRNLGADPAHYEKQLSLEV